MESTARVVSREVTDSQAVFLVWAAPTFGSSRSRFLAKELEIPAPIYLYSTRWKGAWTAPLRYVFHAMQTLRVLFQKRPRVVFVQSPPSFAVLFVALYCAMTNSSYIIDAHSGAFQRSIWTRPKWLYDRITRGATLTLVTDQYFRTMIEQKGGRAMVLRDPVISPPLLPIQQQEQFSVTVVNTFAWDEPLEAVLQAAASLPEVRFSITGKRSRASPSLLRQASGNVVFTDFLPDEAYYQLLRSSHAVMSLTTRDHTLQCGACEALSLERPIITSDWPLLQEYFYRGTVHVDNTPAGIRQGVEALKRDYGRYEAEVVELHQTRLLEWQQQTAKLINLIYQSGPRPALNGVDGSVFQRGLIPITGNEGKPADGFNLIYHGTLAHRYGIDLLIEALAKIRSQIPNIHLLIHGRGEFVEDLRRQARMLEVESLITFSTQDLSMTEVSHLVQQADLGIVPYRRDVFTDNILPTKLMEYASLGVPVLAVDTPSNRQYFSESIVQYFHAGDANDLAGNILWLYENRDQLATLAENAYSVANNSVGIGMQIAMPKA